MLGVVNEFPVANATPPVKLANQLIVPALGVALNVSVPAPHRVAGIVEVIVGVAVIVAVTAVREAEVQVTFVAEA